MKAIQLTEHGAPEVMVWQDTAAPTPDAHGVLVQVHAAGVNRADILQRKGHYPPPPGDSEILGLEVAGTVLSVGKEVKDFAPGDDVFGLVAGGGYAEQCVVDASLLFHKPEAISMQEAAGIAETFFTAEETLCHLGAVQAGETVLIEAAASGVGTIALQMAKALGVRAIVTAGSDEKCQKLLEMGAAHAINYKSDSVKAGVLAVTNGDGVDAIMDFLGGRAFAYHLELLRTAGRMVVIALMEGTEAQINLRQVLRKRLQIKGSVLRSRSVDEKAVIAARLRQNWLPRIAAREVLPLIDSVFPMPDAAKAHQHMEARQHFGKIILSL